MSAPVLHSWGVFEGTVSARDPERTTVYPSPRLRVGENHSLSISVVSEWQGEPGDRGTLHVFTDGTPAATDDVNVDNSNSCRVIVHAELVGLSSIESGEKVRVALWLDQKLIAYRDIDLS
jgi:hypothetical protein